jgi:hypothetical protein
MENAWSLLSQERKEPEGVLTDNFIMKFSRYLDWEILSSHYEFSIDMLRIFFHRVNWASVLKRQKFPEYFLREMAINFEGCWGIVCKYQKLSESFIHDFASKVDWENVVLYQDVSSEFINNHLMYMDRDVPY